MLSLPLDADTLSALAYFHWDIDPVAIKLGPLTFRYYGILFASGLMAAYGLLRTQFARDGEDPDAAVKLTYGLIAGVILGARFGHVFFYEADRYLANPAEIIKFWKGGLASHGAAIGIIIVIAIYVYAIRRIPFRIIADRMAIAMPLATSAVRLGNFFNSEIVGRVTDLPFAVVFVRYDNLPRHPSQLYEVSMGLALFGIIWGVDAYYRRRKQERPLGLLISLFIAGYFLMRFTVEFFKEFQTLSSDGPLTMGQYLSLPFIAIGLYGVWATLKGPWKGQVASTYLEAERARKGGGPTTKDGGSAKSQPAADEASKSRSLTRSEGNRKRRKKSR